MAFEHLMRQNDNVHLPDPRLVALVGIVSNHFGGKTIEVVSGFRAYTPTQYTPHSNPNYGKAMDFRIRGVRNESAPRLLPYAAERRLRLLPEQHLRAHGCPRHEAYWVDLSRPGEPPATRSPGHWPTRASVTFRSRRANRWIHPERPAPPTTGSTGPAGPTERPRRGRAPEPGSSAPAGTPTQAAPGTLAPPAELVAGVR